MSEHDHQPMSDPGAELAHLVNALNEIQQRIFELTGGEVDAIMGPDGKALLTPSAQEELRQEEASQRHFASLLQGILDSLPAHIALLNSKGTIRMVNASWRLFAEMGGIDRGDAHIGVNYIEVCEQSVGDCSEGALEAAAGIRSVLSGEQASFVMEYPCHSPDREQWFRVMATPMAGGEVGGAVVMHVDVSERKSAEEALRTSERRFRELAEHIEDVFYILGPDDLRILYVSPAYECIFGRSRKSLYDDTLSYLDAVLPEDRPGAVEAFERLLRGEATDIEYRIAQPDGSVRWIHDRSFPVRGDDGQLEQFVGTASDITERKRTESRLIEQAALIDQASDAILVRDLEGRVLSWNLGAEKIYGWREEEVIGKPVEDLLYDDPEPLHRAHAAVLETGEWSGELIHRTKASEQVTIFGRWTLLRDAYGSPKSILTINSNISDRKKLEEQFLRAQRMESIGTLASGIAHDLNNVLAPILMSVDMLHDEVSGEDGLSLLRTLRECAQRGSDLISQVMIFARGVEGSRVDLNPMIIVREIEKIVTETFPKSIRFELIAPQDTWTVHAEPTQLHQVLMNLCVNARDAMPEGGRLTIELSNQVVDDVFSGMSVQSQPGPYVVIKVQDTGTGITPEAKAKMFEPFFTTKELGKGTGLGLSTSFTIVQAHGGFINVYSELGKGATFKVYLPAQADENAAVDSPLEQTYLPRGDGELVLLVDDEESIRIVTKKALERFGYRVMLAQNGAEAVSLYAQHREDIAVVLTDMSMPIMDGPAMIVALKSMDPSVRIIGSSGLNSDGHVAKALGAGVEFFVPKPFTAETLLRMLRQALSTYSGPRGHPPRPDHASPADAIAPSSTPATAHETIVVVDDERPLRILAERILSKAGYTVLASASGLDALASIDRHAGPIHLLLTDLNMAGMTGSELIHEAVQRYPGMKVIVMSGDQAMARLEARADGIITKPFSVEQLRTAVREALDA